MPDDSCLLVLNLCFPCGLRFGSGVLKVYIDDLDRPVLSLPISLNNTLALESGM